MVLTSSNRAKRFRVGAVLCRFRMRVPTLFGRGVARAKAAEDSTHSMTLRDLLRALGPVAVLVCSFSALAYGAEPSWPDALSRMPLGATVAELNRTNCVDFMLRAFQSNCVVKALIFMPGATDEFYMFRRARAELTNAAPSLLDAVCALTNETFIRVTFRAPLLLLHTDEDPLEPLVVVEDQRTADKIKHARFVAHGVYNDRDWDFLEPILQHALKTDLRPWRHQFDSWHFYRHSFAAWNLTAWEAMEAAALAGKTKVTVRRKQVVFAVDTRVRAVPKVEFFPR